jgi:hypothetical protein
MVFKTDLARLEVTDDFITVIDVAKGKIITLSVPHSDASAFHTMVC